VEKVKLESRESLLNWYDATNKSYYGLKGPVDTLVSKPVVMGGKPGQEASDGWEFHFNRLGRLILKIRLSNEAEFKTTYAYSEDNLLSNISSFIDGKLWRTSSFIYEGGKLQRVDFIDRKSGEKYSMRNSRQKTSNGWFEIQTPVEKIDLPDYTQYLHDGSMVWSNKGDINNGLGELFYLRTVDSVTSSSVVDQGTENMAGRGGYRYQYNNSGQLKAVESYNAHNNRLFHTTSYVYDKLQLLSSEQKKVVDSSPFSQAIDERVDYRYQEIDHYGNWLARTLNYKSKFESSSFLEKRSIVYYRE